jgi:SSU ribosomal protein S17P
MKDIRNQVDGEYPLRGKEFEGTVVSTAMDKSCTVRWEHTEPAPKYERYERRNTKVSAHVPESAELEEGDRVVVSETRPISKTKSHIVVEVEN